jgi:hypothetical protein
MIVRALDGLRLFVRRGVCFARAGADGWVYLSFGEPAFAGRQGRNWLFRQSR